MRADLIIVQFRAREHSPERHALPSDYTCCCLRCSCRNTRLSRLSESVETSGGKELSYLPDRTLNGEIGTMIESTRSSEYVGRADRRNNQNNQNGLDLEMLDIQFALLFAGYTQPLQSHLIESQSTHATTLTLQVLSRFYICTTVATDLCRDEDRLGHCWESVSEIF
ncbi:hypothetical protein ONS95_014848 [Cadophora gregata]|uniref:uncharacterized protein n=1 Tax=Cadophora gregata TaxID=51156 RepID=UPI0026DBAB0C|nr:uncharacterized protein ONS95_014848 [Cadophora gregata]KAK0113149.1 hypothetical protein ONS95_014848 [Cadophora gregata]KAK0125190.1 hypothetical protein ONS96_009049 [Cadophora gregata f. sp. sojae]